MKSLAGAGAAAVFIAVVATQVVLIAFADSGLGLLAAMAAACLASALAAIRLSRAAPQRGTPASAGEDMPPPESSA